MQSKKPDRSQWPSESEAEFLKLSYKFIYDIFDEVENKSFWDKDPYYRFSRVRDALLVYSELLQYKPIDFVINIIRKLRPPIEAELSREYLLFIRNLLTHFPLFQKWAEVKLSKSLINWSKPGRSIDQFLTKYSGTPEIKYRVWDKKKKEMTYFTIKFPSTYNEDVVIHLEAIISEKEGVRSAMMLMRSILNSQIDQEEEE